MKSPNLLKRLRKKTGLPPGSVVFTGKRKVESVNTHYLQYDQNSLIEKIYDSGSPRELKTSPEELVDWYDIRGLHDTDIIQSIGQKFQIHLLILEDIADIQQRPKFEEHEDYNYIVVRALAFDKSDLKVQTEQVSFLLKKGLLITFQEAETDLFYHVRDRIKNGGGRIRTKGADYLAYALMDSLVDHYFVVLDDIGASIEFIEDQLLTQPDSSTKAKIHLLKKELLIVRKSIGPLREAINRFVKSESDFIEQRTEIYLRDLYDHTIQVMDMTENYRDMLNGLQDLYISEISFKMNQVMQILTIITTVFVPLSFLAGLYGMNFENMPELQYKYGYFILLGVMLSIFIFAMVFFYKKKWL